jgi:hypothetical protein
MEYRMQEADNVQKMLNKIPMPFYIGWFIGRYYATFYRTKRL